jgi:hypothetical protein
VILPERVGKQGSINLDEIEAEPIVEPDAANSSAGLHFKR